MQTKTVIARGNTVISRGLSTRAYAVIKHLRDNPTQAPADAYAEISKTTQLSRVYFDSLRARLNANEPELMARLAISEGKAVAPAAADATQTMVMQTLAASQLLLACAGNLSSAVTLLSVVAACHTTPRLATAS